MKKAALALLFALISTVALAGEAKPGDTGIVTRDNNGFWWIVANPEPIVAGGKNIEYYRYGDDCVPLSGGLITVMATDDTYEMPGIKRKGDTLVRYDKPASTENIYRACPSGLLTFLSKEHANHLVADYQRIQGEKAHIKKLTTQGPAS